VLFKEFLSQRIAGLEDGSTVDVLTRLFIVVVDKGNHVIPVARLVLNGRQGGAAHGSGAHDDYSGAFICLAKLNTEEDAAHGEASAHRRNQEQHALADEGHAAELRVFEGKRQYQQHQDGLDRRLKEAAEVLASAMANHAHIGLGVQEGEGVGREDDCRLSGQGSPGDGRGLKVKSNELRREVGDECQNEV